MRRSGTIGIAGTARPSKPREAAADLKEEFGARAPRFRLIRFKKQNAKAKLSVREAPQGNGQEGQEGREAPAKAGSRPSICRRKRHGTVVSGRADLTPESGLADFANLRRHRLDARVKRTSGRQVMHTSRSPRPARGNYTRSNPVLRNWRGQFAPEFDCRLW